MTTTPSIEVAELLRKIDAGDALLLLLDVRNDDDFATWRVEGRRPVETVHIPYFAFSEDAAGVLARLPRGRQIVALCAKGGASALVVDVLRDAGMAARSLAGGMVAYGDYLEAVKVPLAAGASRFELWQVNRRGKGCLSYVVRAGNDAVVVDPSRHVQHYESLVRDLGARIVGVLDTHVHADHLSGGPALAMRNEVPYCVRAGEGVALSHRVATLADGARMRLGEQPGTTFEIEVIATPGHTADSSSYLLDGRYLLAGDTLFARGVGRPDLGGRPQEWGRELYRTLHQRLGRLPDDTVILPAHSAGVDEIGADGVVCGRLGDLRRTPEFTIDSEDAFVRAVVAAVQPPPASYAEIVRANLGPSVIDTEQATEWELGKNQCAASAAR